MHHLVATKCISIKFFFSPLDHNQDPAWECIQINYNRLLKTLDICRDEHLALERKASSLPKPLFKPTSTTVGSSIFPGNITLFLSFCSV